MIKFSMKIILKITCFLIAFYMLAAFLFNPRVLILLVPPVLIIVLLLFIMYKFARPQFDKLIFFFQRKKADPNSYINQANTNITHGLNHLSKKKAISQKNLELLKQLDDLRKEGTITQQEFDEEKKQILNL